MQVQTPKRPSSGPRKTTAPSLHSGCLTTELTSAVQTVSLTAIRNRNAVLVDATLDWGAPLNFDIDEDYSSRLQQAMRSGSTKLARLLIEGGAAVDETDEFKLKPLHHAICYNHFEMLDLLLSLGVDPIVHQSGLTLLHFAAAVGRLDVVKRLYEIETVKSQVYKEVGNGVTVLMYAAFHWRLGVVKSLLEYGGWAEFVNARDANGNTALKYADQEVDMESWMRGVVGTPDFEYQVNYDIITAYEEREAYAVEELLKQYGAEYESVFGPCCRSNSITSSTKSRPECLSVPQGDLFR
ncbi:hypothetical protein HDU96_009853 [Phlyctochytrium bullatum]|nr:hypothetical protein HDU96_009853 [Phlyctochytrium bullatum]